MFLPVFRPCFKDVDVEERISFRSRHLVDQEMDVFGDIDLMKPSYDSQMRQAIDRVR
jgi:hypothetical protein